MSWNLNSLRARLPRLLELLELHRPEIVCLQETKVSSVDFPHAELRAAGYESVHHSSGRWAGVALLAGPGLEIESPSTGLPGEAAVDEGRWVEATIGGLRLASVYVPNGRSPDSPSFTQKLAFLDAMRARAGDLDAILGDFNVAPADLDVYDPSAFVGGTHVSVAERSRLEALLDAGFVDAFRALHPDAVGHTWWDYRQGHFHRGMGLRIDLALLGTALAPRLLACDIDRNFRKGPRPSDHAPLLVELADATPATGPVGA